uniref:BPTI/Kunitz inhibitor domain-containing protein n=1 Tax=Oryzias sinensis TaxID=183150 RepID=A0A8C7YXA7_9TELE
MPRWYYNEETGSCQMFLYGGCKGNENNFLSEETCKAACTAVTALPSSKKESEEDEGHRDAKDHCNLKPDPGPCRAAFPKFYYDRDSFSCKPFIYGGCRGNANQFDTPEACMASCSGDGVFHGHRKAHSRWTAAIRRSFYRIWTRCPLWSPCLFLRAPNQNRRPNTILVLRQSAVPPRTDFSWRWAVGSKKDRRQTKTFSKADLSPAIFDPQPFILRNSSEEPWF